MRRASTAGPAFITEELSGNILTVTARLTGEVDRVVVEGQEVPVDLKMGGHRDPVERELVVDRLGGYHDLAPVERRW
jgi:hypothetical protein